MSLLPKSLSRVIESFERLPGIGPKSAQRLAFYLLHVPQEQLERFAKSLTDLKTNTVLCSVCRNVTEQDPCMICSNPKRDHGLICVVEQPTDVLSLEKTGKFAGVYHVLHGVIDPLNNIGPDEIYLSDFIKRISVIGNQTAEIILAMNPNMEGEATAMYLVKQLATNSSHQTTDNGHHTTDTIQQKIPLKITRLAHGLPVGADIEYADEVTLSRALEGRREF